MGVGRKQYKAVAGILLLPLCFVVSLVVVRLVIVCVGEFDRAIPLLVGGIAWMVVYPRPGVRDWFYVAGHELTHSLFALVFGYRIRRIKVGRKSGYVELEGTNFLVDLAPYFFPFYTFLVLMGSLVLGFWIDKWWLKPLVHFLLGFTYAFHLNTTVNALCMRQPDILRHGRLFSYCTLVLLNGVFVLVMLSVIQGISVRGLVNILAEEWDRIRKVLSLGCYLISGIANEIFSSLACR